ncbi:MAG TPA: MFS transporter, partial [Bacteroidota bacterium]
AQFGLGASFLTFALICTVATFFFWRLVPETRGRTLEEIERYWIEDADRAARKDAAAGQI